MKVIQAVPGMRSDVTESEIRKFLESRLNMQLATLDSEGYPVIQPVWFYFDSNTSKLYMGTQKMSRKIKHIRDNPDRIYFSIDDENFPYKGVKGRGVAAISEDIQKNVAMIEKINLKYLATLDHPLAKMLSDNARKGVEVVIEITPKFFSAWDYSKS